MTCTNKFWILGLAAGLAFSCGKKDDNKTDAPAGNGTVAAAPTNTLTSKTDISSRLTAFGTSVGEYRDDFGVPASAGGASLHMLARSPLHLASDEKADDLTKPASGADCADMVKELSGYFQDLEGSLTSSEAGGDGMNIKSQFEQMDDDLASTDGAASGMTVENIDKGERYAFYKRVSFDFAEQGSGYFEFGLGATASTFLASNALSFTATDNDTTMSSNVFLDSTAKKISYDMNVAVDSTAQKGTFAVVMQLSGGELPSISYTVDANMTGAESGDLIATAVSTFAKVASNKYQYSIKANGTEEGEPRVADFTVDFTYDGTTCTVD